ncbi:hypothetical protein E3O42_16775 [Cryobacterium adonitolivorans]|uniref:Fimbrial assembly protein n=1 Tax=Cryobacterium adonitolivorans TaxID=1259189 RepID=A0A4R8VXV0_9MICO|nr:hypothetical protein [Cryobacterium adonitolivorans]TFB96792.1 hypothetical protein E3O42_16775 [Cryobacterium adonitolivorans]
MLILGGEPRVDLLPPEVRSRKKTAERRRLLLGACIGAVVLVAGGVAAASWQATQSQTKLTAAQDRTTELLLDQSQYSEVNQVQAAVDTTIAARQFGASTEVDWKAYLTAVREVLPSDVSIDTVTVDSASPLIGFDQATAPLQSARVATLTLGLTSPTLPEVPLWLEAMEGLPGFADGNPGSIALAATGAYTVDVTLHINDGAFSNRFADAEGK